MPRPKRNCGAPNKYGDYVNSDENGEWTFPSEDSVTGDNVVNAEEPEVQGQGRGPEAPVNNQSQQPQNNSENVPRQESNITETQNEPRNDLDIRTEEIQSELQNMSVGEEARASSSRQPEGREGGEGVSIDTPQTNAPNLTNNTENNQGGQNEEINQGEINLEHSTGVSNENNNENEIPNVGQSTMGGGGHPQQLPGREIRTLTTTEMQDFVPKKDYDALRDECMGLKVRCDKLEVAMLAVYETMLPGRLVEIKNANTDIISTEFGEIMNLGMARAENFNRNKLDLLSDEIQIMRPNYRNESVVVEIGEIGRDIWQPAL